jgi:Zn ribbon nucleic-acid-binding protein
MQPAWLRSKRLAIQERIAFLHKIRLRALAIVLGLALAVVGVVSLASAPLWPFIAGAVAIACVAVNSLASRLTHTVCIGCGTDLTHQPVGQYGAVCPSCGTIAQPAKLDGARLAETVPVETADEPDTA